MLLKFQDIVVDFFYMKFEIIAYSYFQIIRLKNKSG